MLLALLPFHFVSCRHNMSTFLRSIISASSLPLPVIVPIFKVPPSSSSSSFAGYAFQVRHKQDWDRGFILLLPQTAELPESVVLLSQHRVLSSKTVRPRAPCGARCIGHAVRIWFAVCSEAPHSQFGEEERPHLCMDE